MPTRTSCQPRAVPLRDAERQVVEELVREDDPGRGVQRGKLVERREDRTCAGGRHRCVLTRAPRERSERLVGRIERKAGALFAAQGRGSFDEDVSERGKAFGRGAPDVAGEPTVSGARFDDEERIGLVERVPALVQSPRDARTEQRPDLGTGDEVAPRAAARREEAALAVEGGFHELIEGNRTIAPDELRDVVRRAQKATSPTFAKICGYTPTTTTTSALSPIATASGCGIWIGERSSVTAGWNHICTITRK